MTNLARLRHDIELVQKALNLQDKEPEWMQRARETQRLLTDYEKAMNEAVAGMTDEDAQRAEQELTQLQAVDMNPESGDYSQAIAIATRQNLLHAYREHKRNGAFVL